LQFNVFGSKSKHSFKLLDKMEDSISAAISIDYQMDYLELEYSSKPK